MKRPGIRVSGLIVVAVPLLLQFVLSMWIMTKLTEASKDAEQVAQQRKVAGDLHRMVWEGIGGIFKMHMDSDTEGLIDSTTTARERRIFSRRVEALRQERWSEAQQPLVAAMKTAGDDLLRCLDWVQAQQAVSQEHWRKVDNKCFEEVNRSTVAFVGSTEKILIEQEGKLLESRKRLEQSRSNLSQITNWTLPVSALVGIALIWFYLYSVLNPLKRVIENGKRLAERRELLAAPVGPSEIEQLDRLLHSVSVSVNEAFERENRMLDNASDLVCSLNQKLFFEKANRYVDRLLGLSNQDVVGQNFTDFVELSQREKVDEHFDEARRLGSAVTFTTRLNRIDRSTTTDTRCSILWSDAQKSFFCVIKDITEEMNINRLKQDFIDMISHDLRSPLMAIHASTTLVAAGAKGAVSPALKEDMEKSSANINLLMDIVNDLLELQKLQSGLFTLERTDFDLATMFQEVFELVQANAVAKNVSLDAMEGSWFLHADKARVSRAFLNFVSNAIKFSPSGATVSVSVVETGNWLEVLVTDDGPGVPVVEREKIFEPFQQVSDSKTKEGTGLGLAISKLIVDGHGGSVGVRDGKAGSGSTFWMRLPRRSD